MAQFGKLSGTITDAQGNPVSGATVEVRFQGAFVTSTQAGPTYTVNDPGGIVNGAQVRANATSSPTRQVTAVTATTITTGGPGLGTLNNNDRISYQSGTPTLYLDAQGSETISNPLTTDASGFWYCWVEIRPYDIIETYGSTVRLKTDLVPEGQENVISNIFQGAAVIAWLRGTLRTLTSGYLFDFQNPTGTTKIRGDYAGNLTMTGNLSAVNGAFSGTESVTGNATIGGTLGVTGATTLTGGATIHSNLTYDGAAGSLSLTAGSIETADLATQCTMITRTADGTADQTTTAAAYATGNYDGASGKGFDITGASITFTPFSSASEIVIMAHCPSRAAGAAAFDAWFAIRDGSGAILHQCENSVAASAKEAGATLLYRTTGLTGSQTFKVSAQSVTNNMSVLNSTWLAGQRTRLVVMEFKR